MSLKKVGQAKKDRFFKIWDILIYGVILLAVAALFLAVTFGYNRSAPGGVEVYYNNNLAFSYDFDSDDYSVLLPQNIAVSDGGDELEITFCTDGGSAEEHTDYNVILIDKSARTVRVTESDCSNRRDCVYTPAITDTSGMITCTPHRLVIMPSGYFGSDDTIPVG